MPVLLRTPANLRDTALPITTRFLHRRVHDVMSLISWVSGFEEEKPQEVMVVAKGGIEPVVLAALSQIQWH